METIQLSLFMLLCLGVHWSSSEILKRQKRNWIIDSFVIEENYKGPFPYVLGTIKVDKSFTRFRITGRGVNEDPKGILTIDPTTGVISVHKPVDYESYRTLALTFQAVNVENNDVDTQLGVEINIKDTNDNAPQFIKAVYEVSIPESTLQGSEVTTIQAPDVDTGDDGRVDYAMVSFTPKHDNVEFYLTQAGSSQTGVISFKGCLEYRKAQKYTIIVSAKDNGKDVQLSSTSTVIINIIDGNNHLPVITGLTGLASVKEGQENVLISRLQVKDEDAQGTVAWRAKFKIHGDSNKNFKITTDPRTNEGLLFVEKHLDYEDSPNKKLNISVENEIPYHTCKVKTRTKSGLWDVVIDGKEKSQRPFPLTVVVEDVNEAPIFLKSNKQVWLKENIATGRYLETFTAEDHDGATGNKIKYGKENDRADWIIVDSKTGKVTTSKSLDRESVFVKNNTYIVNILAADNGKPPMVGTATLTIKISDENDNAPMLNTSILDICQSDKPSKASINAFDLDEGIHSGPFSFRLLGDVKGDWRVEPSYGYFTNLVKESKVHSGNYELQLEVSDLQHKSAVHKLSVTVCDCINPEKPNCRVRKSTGAAAGGKFVGIIFVAGLLVVGLLLLALLVSFKKKKVKIIEEEGSGQHLMSSNIETMGTDCKVVPKHKVSSQNGNQIMKKSEVKTSAAPPSTIQRTASMLRAQQAAAAQRESTIQRTASMLRAKQAAAAQREVQQQAQYFERSMGASSSMRRSQQNKFSSQMISGRQRKYSTEQTNVAVMNGVLPKMLNTKLYTLHAPGEELGDYAPHVYAEEGNREPIDVLDAISIPDIAFNPDLDLVLDSRFNRLASVCMPSKNPTYTGV